MGITYPGRTNKKLFWCFSLYRRFPWEFWDCISSLGTTLQFGRLSRQSWLHCAAMLASDDILIYESCVIPDKHLVIFWRFFFHPRPKSQRSTRNVLSINMYTIIDSMWCYVCFGVPLFSYTTNKVRISLPMKTTLDLFWLI